jgi:hypothetical protein
MKFIKCPRMGANRLIVVTMVSNVIRFRSRYALYRKFVQEMERAGVTLITVEVALGDRPYQITESTNPHHLQLRVWTEYWHKEPAINLGFAHAIRLYPDAEYLAWIDADVSFINQSYENKAHEDEQANWATETIHALQHYQVIQLFSEAIDMSPKGQYVHRHKGYMATYLADRDSKKPRGAGYFDNGHPGYAWAARREALDIVGGLPDFCILGSADRHFAALLLGVVDTTYNHKVHPNYSKPLLAKQALADRWIMRDVGYLPGTLIHYWHGPKAKRKYKERWKILVDNQFDPEKDLVRATNGMWELTHYNPHLRDDLRQYFRERDEDCTYME